MTYLRSTLLGATGALLLSASQILAGPPDAPVVQPAAESPWEFRLEPYGWFAGLRGTTGVLGQTVPTDLSFSDLAHHLKMTYAGQLEIRYNRWGLLTDIMYADIGGYIPVRDPRLQQFALDTKLLVFQVIPNYRLWRSDKGFFDLVAGVRGWDTKLRLTGFRDVSDPEDPFRTFQYFNRSQSKAWVDFVGGARGQYFLYKGLFVAAYGDIGGGSSALTWQVQGTMGYKFTKMISAEAGWRLLSDNYTSGGFIYNVKQQGLYTGVSFTW
jgi:hypothetical protein